VLPQGKKKELFIYLKITRNGEVIFKLFIMKIEKYNKMQTGGFLKQSSKLLRNIPLCFVSSNIIKEIMF
jgi:hypothetical protein